jgi:hypothetical protein
VHQAALFHSVSYSSTLCCVVTDAGGLTLPHPPAAGSTAKPDEGSLELTEKLIRIRAYRFFEERGSEHGHDVEDWLRAKAEVFGRIPAPDAKTPAGEPIS